MELELLLFLGASAAGVLGALGWLWKKSKHAAQKQESPPDSKSAKPQPQTATPVQTPTPPRSPWWGALAKSRDRFLSLLGSGQDSVLKESLEEACLVADLGVQNTKDALDKISWSELQQQSDKVLFAREKIAQSFESWLTPSEELPDWPLRKSSQIDVASPNGPCILWFVGVNGVGKTTSIAKLARELKQKGASVMLAAGDTFRAAASEQLEVWAQRLDVPIVKGQMGSDSSAVIFDAIQSAKAKNINYVLCDSAGRLHNQTQLMEALGKVKRVMAKALPSAPHEVLLVLDANTGQNMLSQAQQFQAAVGVTGLILSKLDGTARGGAVVAVARATGLPIRRLGLGEKAEDFVSFNAREFSRALLGLESLST